MEWKTKIPLTSVICCVPAQWGDKSFLTYDWDI